VGRGIIVALAVSLAVNVLLGGFIAGQMAAGPEAAEPRRHFELWRHGHDDFSDLPPTVRENLKRAFLASREKGGAVREEARALHQKFVAVISADVWDRSAADAVAADYEALEASTRAGIARLIVEAADGLSAEDRRALARHFERRGERGWRKHHIRFDDGEDDGPPPGAPPPD
jgi:uncharacterized membrane protein